MEPLAELQKHFAEIHNLNQASAVLGWDQRVCMPPRGAEARASQLATLAKLAHELFVSPETRDLLLAAEEKGNSLPADSDEAATLRRVRRDFDKADKLPSSLVVEMTEVCSLAEEHWANARKENNYAAFAPWLTRILDLKRQYVQAMGIPAGRVLYDVLLDDYEEAMTAHTLDPLFAELKAATIPLLEVIKAHGDVVDPGIATRECDEKLQEEFCRRVLKECGYDFDRGRLDRAVHPFCTNFSQNDVRITTRFDPHWFAGAFSSCLHEMGHAFYEMNIAPKYEATPLAGGVSLGVHESQSRLWENFVGRSRPFWQHYYPQLQKTFPAAYGNVPLESYYAAVNRVTPSFIRTEADELTYNLHIILRYEMEQELLNKKLSVSDAPAAWNDKMKRYLGLTPPTDREGILQDIHWSGGGIGYFPTYTLGNILGAQLFAAATRALPGLQGEISQGKFSSLFEWLRENVHQHGRKYVPRDLIRRATGQPLTLAPYLTYLRTKFTEIYKL